MELFITMCPACFSNFVQFPFNALVSVILSILASPISDNSNRYDALFEGDTYSIPDSGLPDEWKGQKFYMISGFHRLVNEPKEFHEFLAEASYDITFDLRSGWADEMTSRSNGKFITGWATTNSWFVQFSFSFGTF